MINKTLTLLIVCDGHGGDKCANFAISHFPDQVEQLIKLHGTTRVLEHALTATVDAWDMKCFANPPPINDKSRARIFKNIDIKQYEQHGFGSGSTLVACLVDTAYNEMYAISLGDSRADWQFGQTVDQTIHPLRIKQISKSFKKCHLADD